MANARPMSSRICNVYIQLFQVRTPTDILEEILPCPLTVLVERLHHILFFLLHPPEQPKHWTFSSFGPYPMDIGPREFLGKHPHLQNPTEKKNSECPKDKKMQNRKAD